MTGEQRRCVHVVLDESIGYDHIPDLDTWRQSSGYASKQQSANFEPLDQHGCRGGCRNLADAAQGQHHRNAVQGSSNESAAGVTDRRLDEFKQGNQSVLLFRQGAENAEMRVIAIE